MIRVSVSGASSRVQRREHQMAGFGGDEGRLDRLEVAHFADQDHIRVLTQAAAKRLGKITRIDIDLTLRDKRFLCPCAEIRSGPRS